jgi:hypothetical protein
MKDTDAELKCRLVINNDGVLDIFAVIGGTEFHVLRGTVAGPLKRNIEGIKRGFDDCPFNCDIKGLADSQYITDKGEVKEVRRWEK